MRKKMLAILVALLVLPLPSLAAGGFSTDVDAINAAAKSVLMLEVLDDQGQTIATGSGFVVGDNQTLVTNHHVIEGADMLLAYSDDGYFYLLNKVYVVDEKTDLAILGFMSPTDRVPLTLNQGDIHRAEPVVAIGSPKGMLNTVSMGNVSSVFQDRGVYYVQFTAPISSGSSGGALFNDRGEVIGVTSLVYDDGQGVVQNLNFAVDAREVIRLLGDLDEDKAMSPREYFGGAPSPVSAVSDVSVAAADGGEYRVSFLCSQAGIAQFALAFKAAGQSGGETRLIHAVVGEDGRCWAQLNLPLVVGERYIFAVDTTAQGAEKALQMGASAGNTCSYWPEEYAAEPDFALAITDDCYGEWETIEGDMLKIHVQVENVSKGKRVKSFDLFMYATDEGGSEIYGKDQVYVGTTNLEVAPGQIAYSNYLIVPYASRIHRAYVGIKRIAYADGTTRESDPVDYYYWVVN